MQVQVEGQGEDDLGYTEWQGQLRGWYHWLPDPLFQRKTDLLGSRGFYGLTGEFWNRNTWVLEVLGPPNARLINREGIWPMSPMKQTLILMDTPSPLFLFLLSETLFPRFWDGSLSYFLFWLKYQFLREAFLNLTWPSYPFGHPVILPFYIFSAEFL